MMDYLWTITVFVWVPEYRSRPTSILVYYRPAAATYARERYGNKCAAHIGMGGVKIKKEPCQRDEYVYKIS
jgi:hypothetical protein